MWQIPGNFFRLFCIAFFVIPLSRFSWETSQFTTMLDRRWVFIFKKNMSCPSYLRLQAYEHNSSNICLFCEFNVGHEVPPMYLKAAKWAMLRESLILSVVDWNLSACEKIILIFKFSLHLYLLINYFKFWN